MSRKFIQRLFPAYHRIREHKSLQLLGAVLHDPNLWHLNRRSVAGAFGIGLFVAFLPIPAQMLLAAYIAVVTRVNLPISVLLVWISNPLTMGPIYLGGYTIGRYLLGEPRRGYSFEPSLAWFSTELLPIWKPLFLGCFILGVIAGLSGYMLIRLLWRVHILHQLDSRRRRFLERHRQRRDARAAFKGKDS